MIAALYVQTGGVYFDMPGVDPWDEKRDARKYEGPHPAVAHPPCPRWGKLWAGQPLYIKQTGIRKKKGDDDGCFEAALGSVRKYGGVIEHPWGSHAWPHFGLRVPPRAGGWVKADDFGGWTCCVEQGKYGHYARKPTLLVVYGVLREELPELFWGVTKWEPAPEVVARMGLKRAKRLGELGAKGGGRDSKPRIGTPEPFRDLLLSIARAAGGYKPVPCNGCPTEDECRSLGCGVRFGQIVPDEVANARGIAWARNQAIEHLREISTNWVLDDNERHGAAFVADELRAAAAGVRGDEQ